MNALEFFRRGLNTLEIANLTNRKEWQVVVEIDRLRDLERANANRRRYYAENFRREVAS